MRRQRIVTAGLLVLSLAGCGDLRGFLGDASASRDSGKTQDAGTQKPTQVNPAIRWVSEATEILNLQGPASVKTGAPVTVSALIVIGSSSCNRPGEVQVDVDEASRVITVRATRLKAAADEDIPCTDDYGWTEKSASFTAPAPGTYQVVAEGFQAGFGLPEGGSTQGAFTLVVTE